MVYSVQSAHLSDDPGRPRTRWAKRRGDAAAPPPWATREDPWDRAPLHGLLDDPSSQQIGQKRSRLHRGKKNCDRQVTTVKDHQGLSSPRALNLGTEKLHVGFECLVIFFIKKKLRIYFNKYPEIEGGQIVKPAPPADAETPRTERKPQATRSDDPCPDAAFAHGVEAASVCSQDA
ncbi:hypothetical protein MG293_018549 [Ovis ammon polii]|uniref:Uncharacterized protein n=1 Tax=Ovis ammon polii TaxID=230172 RepID=A0AAD4TTF2_OVIAM|nr:hypothetical protein MG293_018549 [Ovis ammon polii]KAI4551858.1 hypothetical protein MJT46_018110 [Ovis ammon polii x Ovis aries]